MELNARRAPIAAICHGAWMLCSGVCVCACVGGCLRERVGVCVCVRTERECVCERECVGERERVCGRQRVCERERERVCERKRGSV